MALTKITYSMIKAAPFNVMDYAGLATNVTAKDPGDEHSHLLTSFLSWRLPIQAALDACFSAGGGTVVLPKNTVPYYIDDTVHVKGGTTLVCEDWIILADYTTLGHSIDTDGGNIVVRNLMLDNSNIYAGGSGQNGVGIGAGTSLTDRNVKFSGGVVKNCARGVGGPADGGKGFQIESGGGEAIVVDGVTISNCFMGMSTIRNLGTLGNYYGILYSNITADNCDVLFFVRQSGGTQSSTGLQHSVQLNNFYAVNCGGFEGVLQFSRASNVMVSNGIIVNDPTSTPTSLIRGNHANCTFVNICWYGDTSSCVNLDPGTYAVDQSHPNRNNRYDINIWGQLDYFANADVSGAYPTLDSCTGAVSFQSPPRRAFFGYALRNGISVMTMSCNTGPYGLSKIIQVQSNVNYYSSHEPATFEGLEYGAYNQTPYMGSIPTTGTHFPNKIIYNSEAAPGGFIGWVCTTPGTFGTYSEGLTATSNGTSVVTLSGVPIALKVGEYLTIGGAPAGKILSITGAVMIMSNAVAPGSGLSVSYSVPVYKRFGAILS